MAINIRLATPQDAELLPAIERSAAAIFAGQPGLEWVANSKPISAEKHRQYMREGAVWLAVDDDMPVGFISGQIIGSQMHSWELSVAAQFQGRGIGRRLVQAMIDDARARGLQQITFTTFRDVAFNAPFYAQLGFCEVPEGELNDWLRQILQAEAENGLPMERRCAMHMRL